MKFSSFLCSCLFIVFSQAAVYKLKEYNASLKAWKDLKPSTYTYVVHSYSELTDVESITTTTVNNDKVVRRAYWFRDNFNFSNKITTWVEDTPGTIGTHKEGFVPINLDNVYAQCRSNILIQDQVENELYFETENDGLISRCGFFPINCVDDCFRGVIIASITY